MKISRRDLAALLPVLAAANASAQEKSGKQKGPTGPPPVLESKAYDFNSLTKSIDTDTMQQFPVFNGITTRGRRAELHISELAPGKVPHLPHQHLWEEIVMLYEGTLKIELHGKVGEFGHGEEQTVGPGSIIYQASMDVHGMHNPGQTWAKYFVIAFRDPAA